MSESRPPTEGPRGLRRERSSFRLTTGRLRPHAADFPFRGAITSEKLRCPSTGSAMKKVLLMLICGAVGGGCGGDSTGPAPAFTVAIDPQTVSMVGTRTLVNGQPSVVCNYRINLQAAGGRSGEYAEWMNGSVEFQLQATGARSTSFLFPGDLTAWFGSNRIASGQSYVASRSGYWSGPFTAVHTLKYELATGEQRTVQFTLVCN